MSNRLGLHGIGIINVCGRGLEAQRDAVDLPSPGKPSGPPVFRVEPELLRDRLALKQLRRADRFSKMSALAAWDAAAAGLKPAARGTGLGIAVTTAFGPHRTTFEFLDEILDFGDGGVSPTKFSHSVHNAAAAYIAIMLDSRGPACTVTDFERPLADGLLTAAVWLGEGRCTHALVGYTEEWSRPMEYIQDAGRTGLKTRFRQPFNLSPYPEAGISEGSLFLVLTRAEDGGFPLDPADFEGAEGVDGLGALLLRTGALTDPNFPR